MGQNICNPSTKFRHNLFITFALVKPRNKWKNLRHTLFEATARFIHPWSVLGCNLPDGDFFAAAAAADASFRWRNSAKCVTSYVKNMIHCNRVVARRGPRSTLAISGVFKGAWYDAPLWPDHENILQATLYEKVRFLPFSIKNCNIQQCLMVSSHRYNMRLKSPCEIASDMTLADVAERFLKPAASRIGL